jgi:hypothetical protein
MLTSVVLIGKGNDGEISNPAGEELVINSTGVIE